VTAAALTCIEATTNKTRGSDGGRGVNLHFQAKGVKVCCIAFMFFFLLVRLHFME